jgi:hypothetical protein
MILIIFHFSKLSQNMLKILKSIHIYINKRIKRKKHNLQKHKSRENKIIKCKIVKEEISKEE